MEAGDEMSPEDQAGMIEKVQERAAMHRAHNQHAVMKQFMTTFANNMRLSVLADSKGDMPEAERQRLIAKAEAQKQGSNGDDAPTGGGGGPGMGPPPQEEEADGAEEMAPPPPRHAPRRHMLNMAEARRVRSQRHQPRHRLLPEAEGIGFPPPEGMAPDPSSDGMVSDPGAAGPDFRAEYGAEAAPPPPPPPRPRRHHLRMLNARPGERPAHHRHGHAKKAGGGGAHQLPPGVVRDEMGRAMPLLFTGSNPVHSGAFHAMRVSFMATAVVFLFALC